MRKQNKYEQVEAKSYRFWWVRPLGFIFVARGKSWKDLKKGRHNKIFRKAILTTRYMHTRLLERLIFRILRASNIGVNAKQWELSFIADRSERWQAR